jgi:lactam utilization protein B
MLFKEEINVIQEQIDQMADVLVVSGVKLYNKLADDPSLFRAMAKCIRIAVEQLQLEGFSREEAVATATNFFDKIGQNKS